MVFEKAFCRYPCPVGTYQSDANKTSLRDCLPCPPGFFCYREATIVPIECSAGYYCPFQAVNSTQHPCASGTWSNQTGLTAQSQCNTCPAGYFCLTGSNSPSTCPPGTFNPSQRSTTSSACRPCTAGRTCSTAGLSAPDGPCAPGYYCPPGEQP